MTQPKPNLFPVLPAFPNWSFSAKHPDSGSADHVAYAKLTSTMTTKSDLVHQRQVTRVIKGALAGGFHVSSMRVDRDGAIVLFSKHSEPEAHGEPRFSAQTNEWDEVLKK
jgi:hypothetical protein